MLVINFVSYEQLARDVARWSGEIPAHRVVAGVEESGMLPARLLAKKWRKKAVRLSDVAGQDGEGVLVVDDSLNYGGAMRRARELAKGKGFHFAAVYVADPSRASLVDYYCRIVPQIRFFQWNVWKHDVMASACIDMDGVICEDCATEDNDDGPRYAEFLRDAKPLHVPVMKASAIVTGRLEKYRKQTEEWLKRHGVPYGRLIMMQFDTPGQRREYGIARYKSEVYAGHPYRLFIESGLGQASEIAERTGKPVLFIPESGEWRLI